jgi:hypothetical protein
VLIQVLVNCKCTCFCLHLEIGDELSQMNEKL